MAEVVRITPEVAIPIEELEFRASRSSGPGGQGVNTTDSRVDAAGRLRLVAQNQRSQLANRRDATERFAAMLAAAMAVPRTRRPTRPSVASTARRVESKRRRSTTKRLRRRPPPDPGE